MAKKPRDPFDVTLSAEKRQTFTHWLVQQVQDAIDARAVQEREVDYWHMLYEQARTRIGANAPWPGAADLTSYLGTMNVDALHARLMKTVWVEPVWTVEGWGQTAAANAPYVEEFHQWKAEEERLQSVLDKWSLMALIEPRGLIEVREGTTKRLVRKRFWAKLKTTQMADPAGGTDPLGQPLLHTVPVFDDKGQPTFETDDDGNLVEAADTNEPAAEIVADKLETVRSGPQYRILPYRDSLILPGHARDKDDICGYGKRFWRRLGELRESAEAGLYDKEAVDALTNVGDREPEPALMRAHQHIAPQENDRAEKELWEVLVLTDLDGRGERWYLATIHLGQQLLLRLQYDDMDQARFVPVILFPRSDRATEGFSAIGHKLITTIEEHTAWRNMIADRVALQTQVPIKRLTGALWDPLEQPMGPSAVIDVRDMREVEPMQIQDLSAPAIERERSMERTAERLMGVNDVAAGQVVSGQDKTLGEVQMATEQSFVRMDLVIRRFQEAMEDLWQIRHAIYKRLLAEQPEGVEVPQSVSVGLEARGLSLEGGRMTAQQLEGTFRGKPRGSVETADPRALRADFNMLMQAFPAFIQLTPMLMQLYGPQAARAMLDQLVRVYRIPNRQAFLGGQAMQPALAPMPMPGGMPGAAPMAAPLPGAIPSV